ncbi:hypothetical protein ACTA71_010761 [Dictyostelium dimigraforme]
MNKIQDFILNLEYQQIHHQVHGPIVTNIIQYLNSSSTTIIGWLFTFKDEINGFKVGTQLLEVQMVVHDMVIGGGNKWKRNYLIGIPYILNDCVSQNYSIYYAVLTDTFEGLKDDQLPIVYITDTNSMTHKATSSIVSSNSTDIEYTCIIEVQIGFSHPYGFLISV